MGGRLREMPCDVGLAGFQVSNITEPNPQTPGTPNTGQRPKQSCKGWRKSLTEPGQPCCTACSALPPAAGPTEQHPAPGGSAPCDTQAVRLGSPLPAPGRCFLQQAEQKGIFLPGRELPALVLCSCSEPLGGEGLPLRPEPGCEGEAAAEQSTHRSCRLAGKSEREKTQRG